MKTIIMEITLNYMMIEGHKEEVQKLLATGEHKELPGNVRYLVFKEN